jgi:hypothetical protein
VSVPHIFQLDHIEFPTATFTSGEYPSCQTYLRYIDLRTKKLPKRFVDNEINREASFLFLPRWCIHLPGISPLVARYLSCNSHYNRTLQVGVLQHFSNNLFTVAFLGFWSRTSTIQMSSTDLRGMSYFASSHWLSKFHYVSRIMHVRSLYRG